MGFLIITGLSGAGKSNIVNILEDIGYFCVDNMPPQLIGKFSQLLRGSVGKFNKAAVVCDIRSGGMFSEFQNALCDLEKNSIEYDLIYATASENVIINRYKETRRRHPLSKGTRIIEGIKKEQKILEKIKNKATILIDTSRTTTKELAKQIISLYNNEKNEENFTIHVVSFGYKYGIPFDTDLLFDVRFLPNPYYVSELKAKNGKEKEVFEYVMNCEITKVFLEKTKDMLKFLIPHYKEEGKPQLVVSIGCSGGQHRSVVIARELYNFLEENNFKASISHRELELKLA